MTLYVLPCVVESDSSFGLDLHSRITRLIREFIVLGDHCLGEEAFNRFMQERLVSVHPLVLALQCVVRLKCL